MDPIIKALFTPPEIPKRRRKAPAPFVPRLSTTTFTIIGPDGRLCVSVALEGPLGTGKRMVVDDADWRTVSGVLGTRWTLKEARPGYSYVVGLGAAKGVTLARRLMHAEAGQVVAYRDGDRLNLSRGNLEIVAAGEFVARALSGRKATAATDHITQ